MAQTCDCGNSMVKIDSISYSNSVIETWKCEDCGSKKQNCLGLQ